MDINVTSKTAKQARSYKLKPEELAFADLLATGWEAEDAWACAVRKGMTWNRTALKEAIMQLEENVNVQRRIEETKGVLNKRNIERIRNEIDNDSKALLERATNKEAKIIELQAKLESCTDDTQWLKINQQIIDVTRMKQDEVKKDDQTIHHFLPVLYPTNCDNCLIGIAKNKKK